MPRQTSTATTWKRGEEGWTRDGRKARYVGRGLDGGLVVELAHDDDLDLGSYWGHILTVEELLRDEPVPYFSREVRALQEEIEDLRTQRRQLRDEVRAALVEREALLDKAKAMPALRRIEECLDGRITHWAVEKYGAWQVLTHEEALATEESYTKRMKLVTLYGDPRTVDGFEFRINQYSDGSGGDNAVAIPCCSAEEAVEVVRAKIVEGLGPFDSDNRPPALGRLVASAARFGAEIDERWVEYVRERKLQAARDEVSRAQGVVDKAREKLLLAEEAYMGREDGAQ